MGRPAPIHGLSRTETRDSHPETTPHPTGTRRRSFPGSRPIRDGAPSNRTRHCVSRDHDAIDVDSATAKSRAPNEREQEVKDEDKDDVEDDTITDEHRAYLKLVFDALTDGVSGYTLGKSMKELPSVKLLTT